MAKILVTGGAGFIGTNLVEELLPFHQVIVVDNFSTSKRTDIVVGVKFYEVDIMEPDFIRVVATEAPDYIIHLAAQTKVSNSLQEPFFDLNTNILGTLKVIEAARIHQVKKVIYPSSAAVYGNPRFLPISEKHPLEPMSPYGISKHTPEHYLQAYFEIYGLKYTILRLANVYGPLQDSTGEGGVVAIFIDHLLNTKPVQIFGAGNQTRDFIFVKDVATAIVKAIAAGDNRIYNVGSGYEVSINDLFCQLQTLLKSKLKPEYLPARPGDILSSVFDISKIQNELEWEPQVNLTQGLVETIQWFQRTKL